MCVNYICLNYNFDSVREVRVCCIVMLKFYEEASTKAGNLEARSKRGGKISQFLSVLFWIK